MSGITRIFRLLREQFLFENRTCRMWLGIGMGVSLFFFSVQQFMEFVQLRGEPANIFDGFLYSATDPQSSMLIVLGYLFLLSDAPFVNERTLQLVIRTSRKIWNSSCIMYIGLMAFFYYGTILLLSMLLLAENGYWGESWSIPLSQVAQNGNLMIFRFSVSFPYWNFMQEYSPIHACALVFIGNCLYAFFMGCMLYLGNLGMKYSLGTWAVLFVHFSGYIARREWNPKWSLQSYSSPAENGNFFPLAVLAVAIVLISYIRVRNIDYQVLDKEI